MTSNISVGTGAAHSQSSEPRMIQMLAEDGNRVEYATVDRIEEKLGHHASPTCSVIRRGPRISRSAWTT